MTIATWNVERLKHGADKIAEACKAINADILVLTETDERLELPYSHCFTTERDKMQLYRETERRVIVYTNYPEIKRYSTYDSTRSLCVGLDTEYGKLLVYGIVIGPFGNRHPSFLEDARSQAKDFELVAQAGMNLCYIGDFNCSFSDNYYFTGKGREVILDTLNKNGLRLVMAEQPECVDHIALTAGMTDGTEMLIEEWNQDKQLSDHKGILVKLSSS